MSIFITGASAGIGAACARAFAEAGKDLVLVARREDRLRALAEELRARHKVRVSTFELDVRSREAVDSLVAGNAEVVGSVDVLVNNAGMARGFEGLHEGDPRDWDEMIDTNVKGLLYVTRALLPGMIKRGEGHVINIGSVAGYWVYPKGGVYCATKYAVRALTEGLRQDLHGTGLRVTEVSPGMVETDFSKVRFDGDEKRAAAVYAGTEPLTPEDIAETVLWCASRPKRVNIQEVIVFPTAQSAVGLVQRKSQ
jgi:serine 3-dehydrogenase